MSTADGKVDFLFKKSFGVPFSSPGAAFNEEAPYEAYKRIYPSRQIYAQAMPNTSADVALGASTPVSGGGTVQKGASPYAHIAKYMDIPLTFFVSGVSYKYGGRDVKDAFNLLTDSFPPLYDPGQSFSPTVYIGTRVIPDNDGTDGWLLDTDAGILTFTGAADTTRNGTVKISFWRYEGTKGISGGAGGVGDAADGQLLYDNSGSVSGSSITYVPSGTATYTYTGTSEKFTGIAVGTKTYADGSRRYVIGRMQQLIPTASGTPPSRDISGFYGGVNDFPFFRQPFSDIFYDSNHNIVTKTFTGITGDSKTYVLIAIGNRVAWRNASSTDNTDADTPWSTYDLPFGEIIFDVVFGASFTDQKLVVVTTSGTTPPTLRYMTINFVGTSLTYSALTDINGSADIIGQGNSLSGLYYVDVAVAISVTPPYTIPPPPSAYPVFVPSRVFMVTYKRDASITVISSQKNVSVILAYCQPESSAIYNFLLDRANQFYSSLMAAPIPFVNAPCGILQLLIPPPNRDLLPVGLVPHPYYPNQYNHIFEQVNTSNVFGFNYIAQYNQINAFIHSNLYFAHNMQNNTNTYHFFNWSTYELLNNGDSSQTYVFDTPGSALANTIKPKLYIVPLSTTRFTLYLYSSMMIFEPFELNFGSINISSIGNVTYNFPNTLPKYPCSNTVFITAPTFNYLLAAETSNVLSFKRYSLGDASNNMLEGSRAYPTYTSINGVVRYERLSTAATGSSVTAVEAATGSTTIATVSKATSYTNGTQTVTTSRAPAVKISNQDPYYTVDVNGTLRVQNQSTFLGGYNFTGKPIYPGVINLGFNYGPQIRSVYPTGYTDTISLQFLTNAAGNDPTLVPRMHIAAPSGNVGIGTTTPTCTLDVVGLIKVRAGGAAPLYPGINTGENDSNSGQLIWDSTTTSLVMQTSSRLHPIEIQGTKVTVSSVRNIYNIASQGIPIITGGKYLVGASSIDTQFIVRGTVGTNTTQLKLGAYASPDTNNSPANTVSIIQSCYKNGSNDIGTSLSINPLGGNVMIGNNSYISAKLVVSGILYTETGDAADFYYWQGRVYDKNGIADGVVVASSNTEVSIYAEDVIWTQRGFAASSDKRIKKDIFDISDGDALEKLRKVEPAEYNYIDITTGNKRVYGFIAQQVREHFPEAVTLQKNIVPTFYQLCDVSYNDTAMTLTDISDKAVLATVIPGESIVQILDCSGRKHTPPVRVVDISAGSITFDISGLEITKDISGGKMFLYGMGVDDFHTLNKDYLFTINFAATQEIDREVQRLRKDNTALTDRVTNLEAQVAPLDNRVAALETQVSTLTGQNTALQQKLVALLARLGITDL